MSKVKFFLIALFILFAAASQAQIYKTDKGFTVQVAMGMYNEGGETKSYELNEIYNVDFKDKLLVHNVLDEEGTVKDSQLYKMISLKFNSDGSVSFGAKSGVTGNVYGYKITNEGSVSQVTRTQPNGSSEVFLGVAVIFKSLKQ